MGTNTSLAHSGKLASLSSERGFLLSSALLFIASAGVTVYLAGSLAVGWPMTVGHGTTMPETAMPAAQTGLGAAASFMGMWVVMMAAMMLPSLAPTLLRYRSGLRAAGQVRLAAPTALAGAGYFATWAVFGVVAYPLSLGLAAANMPWMGLAALVPIASGVALLFAGVYQVSSWKVRRQSDRGAGAEDGLGAGILADSPFGQNAIHLSDVIGDVAGIDRQPIVHAHQPVLRVLYGVRPGRLRQALGEQVVVVPQPPEQLHSVLGALRMVIEQPGPGVFVIGHHRLARLGDQAPQPDEAVGFTIGDVDHDFVDRPVFDWRAVWPHFARVALQSGGQLLESRAIGLDF